MQRELLHGHENEHEGSKKIYELLTRKAKRIVKLKNGSTICKTPRSKTTQTSYE